MNTIGSAVNQNVTNVAIAINRLSNVAKSNTVTSLKSDGGAVVPQALPKEVLTLYVNMIKELLGLLKSKPDSESGFSLSFPSMPTYSDRDHAGENFFSSLAPLPSFIRDGDASEASTSAFNMAPLPSLANTANASTNSSNTHTSTAFAPIAIPSLLGNSTELPSVTTASTSAGSANESATTPSTPRAFAPIAIPSLLGNSTELPSVNAATSTLAGSANESTTPSTPRAFAPIAIPSLLGNSTELPSVTTGSTSTGSPNESATPRAFSPIAIPSLLGNSAELPSVTTTSTSAGSVNESTSTAFSPITIPSLLGNKDLAALGSIGRAIPSLSGNSTLLSLGSAQGFSLNGAKEVVDGLDRRVDNGKGGKSHFK